MKIKYGQRKAISPIIATVLIIAVTLIAAVAIGGFVFGLFGSSTNTAQIQAVSTALSSAGTVGTFAPGCSATALAGAGAGNVQLSNTGSANAIVTSVSLTYGGKTYSAATPTTGCTVTSGSSLYITIAATAYPATASAGQQFTGFVVTNNGAQVVFTGAFS